MFKENFIKPPLVALATCVAAGAVMLYVLLYKYHHFGYYDWDLAFFTQACWNLLHGSQYVSLVGINYFGDHSYFITFLYLPFFALFPHPLTLVFLKLAAYLISAFLLFRIFYRQSGFAIAFGLMAGYLILPASIFTLLYDFNPESLAMPFIVLLFDAFSRKQWLRFWVCAACLLMIKENFALVIGAFAVYGLCTGKDAERRTHAGLLMVISVAVFYMLTEWIIPHFRNMSTHAFVVRYAHLGGSVGEIAANILLHPDRIVAYAMKPINTVFVTQLFGPWLYPSIFGFPVLFVASPLFLQHILSSSNQEHSIHYHYGMTFAPFIFIAVHQAVCLLRRWIWPIVLKILLYVVLVIACWVLSTHAEGILYRVDYHADGMSAARWKLVQRIPPQASVVATFDFLAPLATRTELYSFHKIYDEFFQNPEKLAQSELNVRSNFVLPEHVTYAIIDFSDHWMAGSFFRAPEATRQRIDDFLSRWHPVEGYGSMYLFRKNTHENEK